MYAVYMEAISFIRLTERIGSTFLSRSVKNPPTLFVLHGQWKPLSVHIAEKINMNSLCNNEYYRFRVDDDRVPPYTTDRILQSPLQTIALGISPNTFPEHPKTLSGKITLNVLTVSECVNLTFPFILTHRTGSPL